MLRMSKIAPSIFLCGAIFGQKSKSLNAILRQKNIYISRVNLKKIQKRGNFWTLEKDNNVYKIRSLLNPIIKFPKKKKKNYSLVLFFRCPKTKWGNSWTSLFNIPFRI